jgi:hypothetical protein
MPTYRLLATALFLFSSTALVPAAARAADFRVDNSVFVEGQSQPQSQGVTLFHEGLVYDFLSEPAEVIIFDKAHRRFILLDLSRHVRSEISTADVQTFVNRAQQRLSGHPNPHIKWLADPSFEESFDRDNSELTLKSPSITYQVRLQTTDAAVAAQYHEFSDWYAKLNHTLNPKSRPPFPRMMLDEAIDRHQGVAKEVHLTAALGAKDLPLKITSRHQLAVELDADDMNRVAKVRDYLRSFPSVSLSEYRQGK